MGARSAHDGDACSVSACSNGIVVRLGDRQLGAERLISFYGRMKSRYPEPGTVLGGKYRIERLLGEGGMGAVARAQHLLTRAPCALKFMNPEYMNLPGAVERFLKEGQAAARIRSDHVVQIYDVDKLPDGAPYIAMECLDGADLDSIIEHQGSGGLPVARAVHFTIQILRALQAAHGVGIVHRDVKPGNCFVVAKDGEVDFVKLLDFGISKVSQPGQASLTQTNSALGTPLYMSPEQASAPKEVDTRSDLYSAGVILFELLTGATPFAAESGELTELLFKIFTAEVPSPRVRNPNVPEALAAVVLHALARKPDSRYQSALEFVDALAPFADARSALSVARVRAYVPPDLIEDTWAVAPMTAFSGLQGRTTEPPEDLLEATRADGALPGGTLALVRAPVPSNLGLEATADAGTSEPRLRTRQQGRNAPETATASPQSLVETASVVGQSMAAPERSTRSPWILVAGAAAAVAVLSVALAIRTTNGSRQDVAHVDAQSAVQSTSEARSIAHEPRDAGVEEFRMPTSATTAAFLVASNAPSVRMGPERKLTLPSTPTSLPRPRTTSSTQAALRTGIDP
jgi:eukaryotic-like serine/threonine-protein kinase